MLDGVEVTGASIYEYLATGEGLELWPAGTPIESGAAERYPSICTFTYPFAEYVDGQVLTIEGLEEVSSLEYPPVTHARVGPDAP